MRKLVFENHECYHVYNRGVDKRTVFHSPNHYRHFINTINRILTTGSATPRLIYNQSQALNHNIDILAYCLMPNHYHFLVRQRSDAGVTRFMQQLNTSYTKYINLNQQRTGHLFEYAFKAKHIETDEQLLHVSRYIHLNPFLAGLVDTIEAYEWSSYPEFLRRRKRLFIKPNDILAHFADLSSYEQFVLDQKEYAALLKKAKVEKQGEDGLFL